MIRAETWKHAIFTGPKGGVWRELLGLQRCPSQIVTQSTHLEGASCLPAFL